MRFASLMCLTLSILGCSEISTPRSPTVPTPRVATPPPTPPPSPLPPQPSNLVAFWGIVVGPSGECIEGATVEVVAGPLLVGQKATQRLPCDLTRFTGGFEFDESVPMGVPMTLRASAPGYVSRVQTVEMVWWELLRLTLVPTASDD